MDQMILENGRPSNQFKAMIHGMVEAWIQHEKRSPEPSQFIVISVQERDGRVSYWGLIDAQTTPEEDLYVEVERRAYCGYRTIGQEKIWGCGMLDIFSVLDRDPLPWPPGAS